MKNKRGLNNILSTDRKALYIILSIVMISVLTLTVVYAALSTTLNISGNAEVSSASWNIHLDNVQLNSSSATTTVPTITDARTATFSTTLTKPGDFYEFTIDVVNDGSIDAMIDGVTKTPELSDTQKKYLNYIVEYQNGESINNKQLVSKGSFVRLKVKLEFRKDITASDLPTTSETLNLSFSVNYVQADTTGTSVKDDGVKKVLDIVSGNLQTVGSEVAIGDEHFYIMKNDGEYITMLTKMNITTEATPKQSSSAQKLAFSSTAYWSSTVSKYPAYVYDSNSKLYNYIENYKTYLEDQGAEIEEARLINKEELDTLGCSTYDFSCGGAASWVYATKYWTGVSYGSSVIWIVRSLGNFNYLESYSIDYDYGIRPVIVIKS